MNLLPFLPYIQLLAAFYLLYMVTVINTRGFWYGFLYKFLPFTLFIIMMLDSMDRLEWINLNFQTLT